MDNEIKSHFDKFYQRLIFSETVGKEEKTYNSSNPCDYRGGDFGSFGSYNQAASLTIDGTTYFLYDLGFRVVLY